MSQDEEKMSIHLHCSCLVLIGNVWVNFGVICHFRLSFSCLVNESISYSVNPTS